jgi:Na+/proline symporter
VVWEDMIRSTWFMWLTAIAGGAGCILALGALQVAWEEGIGEALPIIGVTAVLFIPLYLRVKRRLD